MLQFLAVRYFDYRSCALTPWGICPQAVSNYIAILAADAKITNIDLLARDGDSR
ncbi:hypothetical protein AAIB41_17310 [Brucella sp. BE17]|uniref:hypothetical protein n=1 Tax=Brucella sp. BE17 TaxID=3142977 RepID=UPI0031BAE748